MKKDKNEKIKIEKNKSVTKPIKKSKWTRIKETFFYDEHRIEISRTAIMNFSFWVLILITWIMWLILSVWITVYMILHKMGLPITLLVGFFSWTAGICGGGFLQYSYTKKLNKASEVIVGNVKNIIRK